MISWGWCDEQKSYQYQLSSSNLTSLTANVHISKEEKIHKSTMCIYIYIPGDSKWPFDSLVGGHLTSERVALPSQKGHKELPGIYIFVIHTMLDVSITWQLFFLGSVTSFDSLIFHAAASQDLEHFLQSYASHEEICHYGCTSCTFTSCTKNGHMVAHLMHENAWKKMHGETHGSVTAVCGKKSSKFPLWEVNHFLKWFLEFMINPPKKKLTPCQGSCLKGPPQSIAARSPRLLARLPGGNGRSRTS